MLAVEKVSLYVAVNYINTIGATVGWRGRWRKTWEKRTIGTNQKKRVKVKLNETA